MSKDFIDYFPEFAGKIHEEQTPDGFFEVILKEDVESILQEDFVRREIFEQHNKNLIESFEKSTIDKKKVRKIIENNISSWNKRYTKYGLKEGSREWVKTNLAIIVLKKLLEELELHKPEVNGSSPLDGKTEGGDALTSHK